MAIADWHFNKIIKGPGISFWSPTLSQKYVRNVCHTAHKHLTKFYFDSTWDSEEMSIFVTFIMQPSKFASALSNCQSFCQRKSVFSLMRQNFLNNINVNFCINSCN